VNYVSQKAVSRRGELAERCNVPRQTINVIENNKYDPTLQLAFRLAKVLKVKVDELFHAVEEEKISDN